MKKRTIAGLTCLLSSMAFSETYYLQKDMNTDGNNNSPLIKEIWFSQRSGGGDHPDKMTRNIFSVNGKAWRTPNSEGTSRFTGTLLVDEQGAGTGELLSAVWKPAKLVFESEALMRLRRTEVTLQPELLTINGQGNAVFRAHSDGSLALFLEPLKMEGGGQITFGKYKATDEKALWSLMCPVLAGFSGTVAVDYGTLTIETPLDLTSATLSLNSENGAGLVVADVELTIKRMVIDGKPVPPGSYKAREIGDGCIKGSGRIIVLSADPEIIG
jgi:hypothetical protein